MTWLALRKNTISFVELLARSAAVYPCGAVGFSAEMASSSP